MISKPAVTALAGVSVLAAAIAFADPQAPQTAPEDARIVVRGLIGELTVITGGSGDLTVDVSNDANLGPPEMLRGGDTIHMSWPEHDMVNCWSERGETIVRLRHGGPKLHQKDMPKVTVRAPAGVSADIELLAGKAEIGDTATLRAENKGCGDMKIGDVAGPAELYITGSGDLVAGNTGDLTAAITGSGDLSVGDVDGPADLSIQGSGDLSLRSVNGDVTAQVMGSGDIAIAGGAIPVLKAQVMGSGDIAIDADVGEAEASVFGSGDIEIARVSGALRASEFGSGEVSVRRR